MHAGKIRNFGSSTFPAEQIVEAQWVAEKRGRERFRTEQPPYSILVRGIERDVLPTAQRTAWASSPGAHSPVDGCRARFGEGKENMSAARATIPARYDLGAAGQPAEARGRRLNWLPSPKKRASRSSRCPLAFVLEHPAISAAIIGPRTMEQLESQLSAPDVRLDESVLDRIDQIVPPGTNLNPLDSGWSPSVLANPKKRRRHYR